MIYIADGQQSFTDTSFNSVNNRIDITQLAPTLSPFPSPSQLVSAIQQSPFELSKFGEFLMGNAQILATIVAVGFSIYTFVLGMKVSRLALRLILKKEGVIKKFSTSLILVGILSSLSIFSFLHFPSLLIVIIFVLVIFAYSLPAFWLVKLSMSLSTYLKPDSVIKLISENLSKSIAEGYEVETGQIKIQDNLQSACEKAGIELIPRGFASLYEAAIAVLANRNGYINKFNENKIEKIGQLLNPIITSESVSESSLSESSNNQEKKVRIYQNIGSFIDPTSNSQALKIVASVDGDVENKDKIIELLKSVFEVSKKDEFAIEINNLLVDLKNHILEIIESRNLDEYKKNTTIFTTLLEEHYKQCKDNNKQSLSYLNPIREIIAELLEKTLQIKSPRWSGETIGLFYSILYLAIENDDDYLFKQFSTLFRTMYTLSREFNLKESLWTSHHLFYEILNYHLQPKLERELKKYDNPEDRKKRLENAKTFVWTIFISLSENLKNAYRQDDIDYTTSVIRMLKGSLKYLGDHENIPELVELKQWYKISLIKLWLNQLGYAFVFLDKRSKKNEDIFDLLLSSTSEYSLEELSDVVTNNNRRQGYNFPDFMDIMHDEESEYSGTAISMGNPDTFYFKAYVIAAITRSDLNNQKSVPISDYFCEELKKTAESFRSGSYSELVPKLDEDVINSFITISEQAREVYKTQVEEEIINSPLDSSLITRFKENAYRGWNSLGSMRTLFKRHKKLIKKLDECPTPNNSILLRGFIQRHSKEYFISQDRIGYTRDYGYEYGKALSEGEDLNIFETLIQAVHPVNIDVKGKNAGQILELVLNAKKSQDNTIMFVPFDLWEFEYRNSKYFTPKHKLSKTDKLKDLRGFIGYYMHAKRKVPILYSPERKRGNKQLLMVDVSTVGRLILYKPHEDAERGKEVYADIRPFTDSEIQQIIIANPSSMHGLNDEAKRRKLNQEVALRVLERYSFEIQNKENIQVFNLDGLGSEIS